MSTTPKKPDALVTLFVDAFCHRCNRHMLVDHLKSHVECRCPTCGAFRGVFCTTTSRPTAFAINHDSL